MAREPWELTADEAIAMLADGDEVHCILNPNIDMLLGADWAREDVIKLIRSSSDIRATGPMAQSMGHGVAALANGDWHYFSTK